MWEVWVFERNSWQWVVIGASDPVDALMYLPLEYTANLVVCLETHRPPGAVVS